MAGRSGGCPHCMRKHARKDVAQRLLSSPSTDGRLFHRDADWAARREPAPLEKPQSLP
jgi:hypothetical protein